MGTLQSSFYFKKHKTPALLNMGSMISATINHHIHLDLALIHGTWSTQVFPDCHECQRPHKSSRLTFICSRIGCSTFVSCRGFAGELYKTLLQHTPIHLLPYEMSLTSLLQTWQKILFMVFQLYGKISECMGVYLNEITRITMMNDYCNNMV